jgi:hypothetical protein
MARSPERADVLLTRNAELTSRKATLVAHKSFWSLHRNAAQCFRTMAEPLVLSQAAVTQKERNALHARLADVELCEDYLPHLLKGYMPFAVASRVICDIRACPRTPQTLSRPSPNALRNQPRRNGAATTCVTGRLHWCSATWPTACRRSTCRHRAP